MTDQIRNVLVQLGAPALWERMGAGLVAQSDAIGEALSAQTYGESWRCALTRAQRGSWVARMDVLQTRSSGYAYLFGLMPCEDFATMSSRRPVNIDAAPNLYLLNNRGRGIGILRSGAVTRCTGSVNETIGNLPASAMGAGRSIWMIRDAHSRTLTFRAGDPLTGQAVTVPDVDGDWRIAANVIASGTRLRLVHDVEHLRALPDYRPAGVWGRLATLGVTDAGDPANITTWAGRIAHDGDPTFDVSVSFAVMGRSRGSRGIGDVVVANNSEGAPSARRALDAWLEWDVRGEPMTIMRGIYGQPVSQAQVMARVHVESISEASGNTLAISCRDALAALDMPWQRDIYPAGVVESLEGRTKPTALGLCNFAPLALTDAAALSYDIADDMLQHIAAVFDRGVALTPGAGYRVNGDGAGLQRLTNPAGLQCASVLGGGLDGTVYVSAAIGDFAVWEGAPAAPRGWGRENNVSNNVQGAHFYRAAAPGSPVPGLNLTEWLPSAERLVRVDLEFAAGGTGTLEVQFLNDAGAPMATTSVEPAGRQALLLRKPAGAVRLRLQMGSPGALIVRRVRACDFVGIGSCWQAVTYAACYRGALPAEAIDPALFQGILPDAGNYPIGLATPAGDSRRVADVVDDMLASIGCAAFINRDGKFQPVALQDPGTLAPALTLDDSAIIGDVRVELDHAGGLSSRVSAVRTFAVHSPGDIADSLYANPALANRAAALQSEYASTVVGANRLAPLYAWAESAEPVGTVLSSASGAQTLANRLTAIYSAPRHFYTLTAALDDVTALQPGQCVTLQHAGRSRNLLVLGISGRFADSVVNLTLWG